jgi:Fungal specific transcription factor domain
MKRGEADQCIYVEPPEDEKTKALRARLEYLEAQVQEISSSIATAESNSTPPEPEAEPEPDPLEADIDLIDQFSRLRLRQDRHVYYGPNCRYGLIMEFPEIFAQHKHDEDKALKHKCKEDDDSYYFPSTSFPFNSISTTDNDLQAMLPPKILCDRLIGRYFECSNSLFCVIEPAVYWQYYPLLWASQSTPQTRPLLAITFLMMAIAARSLNEGNEILNMISAEGQTGALNLSRRLKKVGQLALSQNGLFQRSSLSNIQCTLLLFYLEDREYVRYNMLGMLVTMAKIAGLYRNPEVFSELDAVQRQIRRRLWMFIFIFDQTGWYTSALALMETEANHFGHPALISQGSFDCEPSQPPEDSIPDPDDMFIYWMFKLHIEFSKSFPGVIGIHKSLSAVRQCDEKVREVLQQLPAMPHLSGRAQLRLCVDMSSVVLRKASS